MRGVPGKAPAIVVGGSIVATLASALALRPQSTAVLGALLIELLAVSLIGVTQIVLQWQRYRAVMDLVRATEYRVSVVIHADGGIEVGRDSEINTRSEEG
jgi:hypothetical protein